MKKLLLAFLLISSTVYAQQTPAQVYLAYRAALEHATSVDQLRPFLSAPVLVQVDAVPSKEKVLDQIKQLTIAYQIHVTAETDTPDGHVLIVDGVDGGDRPIRGTVDLVKEANTWKIAKETWHSR